MKFVQLLILGGSLSVSACGIQLAGQTEPAPDAPSAGYMDAAVTAFQAQYDQCSATHGYDPDALPPLGDFELAPTELDWRECVYDAIRDVLIPESRSPEMYFSLIADDQRLTQAVTAGQTTRAQRRAEIEASLAAIRQTEEEVDRRIAAEAALEESQTIAFTQRMVEDLRGLAR